MENNPINKENQRDPADLPIYLGITAVSGVVTTGLAVAVAEHVGTPYTAAGAIGFGIVFVDYGIKLVNTLRDHK
jgi:hypothetical protein